MINKENDYLFQKTHIAPASVQRSCKYKNCYILNNLNNYQPNVIIGNKTKTNKYTNNIIINSKTNNNSKIDNDINLKNTNGAASINNNKVNNNSLIQSPINCLNTITFNINNNFNNCFSSNTHDHNEPINLVKLEGFNIANGLMNMNNKSLSNLNEFSYFSSREKILKKLEQQNHLNLANNSKKEINSIKNQNNNKITTLFKAKTKAKIFPKQNLYSNTANINSYTNNIKKSNISSVNNTNSIINNNTNNKINEKSDLNNNINNYNYILKESDKIKIFTDSNSNNNTNNSYSNLVNKNLINGNEEENNNCNEEYFNEFNNIDNNPNNKRNYNYKMNYSGVKSLHSINSYQRNINNNENNVIEKSNNNENKNKDNLAFQTYSGYFRNNLIKVNVIDKENKNTKNINQNNINGNTYEDNIENEKIILNSAQKKDIVGRNKNIIKSKNSIQNSINSIKRNDIKNLYIKTDFKNNKRYKKQINISNRYNKNNEKSKNDKNILIQNYCENNNNIANEEFNNNSNNEDKNNGKQNEKSLKDLYYNISYRPNIISPNNTKLNKNSSLNSTTTNSVNFNIFPLSRDNSTTYIKKKCSNMSVYNNCRANDYLSSTNKIKHKKNYSISQSCYNTQRNSKYGKVNSNNKNNNKDNYLYSPKNNKIEKIENKNIIMPEYKMKLENIKSRISNLLNVYSLLALKNINILNDNKEIENINSNKNEC